MKQIVNIFLSFYILTLACMPCKDTPEGVRKTNETFISNHSQNQQDNHDLDFCSPLCGCSCCGVVVLPTHYYHIFDFQLISEKTTFFSEIKNTSNFNSSLWQPPRFTA